MRIRVKRFDDCLCRAFRMCVFTIDSSVDVGQVKKVISEKLGVDTSEFHLESSILSVRVLLTETFPLDFFFNSDSSTIFMVLHKTFGLPQSSLEECVRVLINESIYSLSDLLLDGPEDLINTKYTNGWGLIHFSALYGKDEALILLIELGSNLNQETKDGWTPLQLAAAHGQTNSVNILLQQPNIQINKVTQRGTALHIAVGYGNLDIVSMLLKAKACCTLENAQGKTPIEIADDESILNLIPVYQGMIELEKYSDKNKPGMFKGHVISYNTSSIHDKYVFMCINVDLGRLEEYTSKNDYSQEKSPNKSYNLHDITHVGPVRSGIRLLKNNFYFEIVTNNSKYFYTKDEILRDQWVNQICLAVDYCQFHKVGSKSGEASTADEEEDYIQNEEDAKILLESLQRVKEIGAGSFGVVYKVVKRGTNEEYAMKCLSKPFLERKHMLKYAISEIKIMQQLSHPYILHLNYSIENSSCIYLVLDYCSGGDLESLIDKIRLPPEISKHFLAEILLGLEYMHSLDIIYRDLKPANILLHSDGHIKLADFGLAKSFQGNDDITSTLVGSPAYIAPEILCREKLTKAADIYSYGIVMHEVICGRLPFAELQIDKLLESVKGGKTSISKELTPQARAIVRILIQRNPKKRPGFAEIKKHEFFVGVDWDELAQGRGGINEKVLAEFVKFIPFGKKIRM